MNMGPRALITISLVAILGATVVATAQEVDKKPAHAQHSMQGMDRDMANMSEGSKQLHQVMMSGMRMPMPMTGNVDTDFATMMTMHHKQAIEMSDVLLKHGKNSELRALAQKMRTSQREEIEKMAPYVAPPKK